MTEKILALILLAGAALPAAGGEAKTADPRLAGGGFFSDPAFQDMVETSDGYLNPRNTRLIRSDFDKPAGPCDLRDAPVSPAASLKDAPPSPRPLPEDRPGLPDMQGNYKVTFAGDSGPVGSYVGPLDSASRGFAREYALLGVSVKGQSYEELLPKLEAAGFRFAGEKISHAAKASRTVLLGWAPSSALPVVARVPGVTGVSVEKRAAGVPLKARVRITLKVPYQNKPGRFVPDFIKRLSDKGGFETETWFRLPQQTADSKFSVFEVAGSIPVDLIGDLSRSPFVSSVELRDAAL